MQLEYSIDNYILKVLDEGHADIVLDFYKRNKESFNPYETAKPENFYSTEYIALMLNTEYNAIIKGKYVRFYLFEKDKPDYVVATFSFSNIILGYTKSCNIGYKVDIAYQNRGIATKFIPICVNLVIADKNIHRFNSYVLTTNYPSLKVMEKLNWIDEGIAHKYAYLDHDWRDHKHFVYINN